MGDELTVVSFTKKDIMNLEMIVLDSDKEEALIFLKDLRWRIQENTIKGLKSHLDR